MTFAVQITKTLNVEGVYTDDPNDPGGATIYGVTETIARASGYTGLMQNMTKVQALSILQSVFYLDPAFDRIAAVDDGVGDLLLDLGVNLGPGAVSKYLQAALNALNYPAGSLGAALTPDGRIGTFTVTALTKYKAVRGADGIKVLRAMILGQATAHYIDVTNTTPTQKKYEYGWILQRILGNQ